MKFFPIKKKYSVDSQLTQSPQKCLVGAGNRPPFPQNPALLPLTHSVPAIMGSVMWMQHHQHQDLCTCCSLCLERSSHRYPMTCRSRPSGVCSNVTLSLKLSWMSLYPTWHNLPPLPYFIFLLALITWRIMDLFADCFYHLSPHTRIRAPWGQGLCFTYDCVTVPRTVPSTRQALHKYSSNEWMHYRTNTWKLRTIICHANRGKKKIQSYW